MRDEEKKEPVVDGGQNASRPVDEGVYEVIEESGAGGSVHVESGHSSWRGAFTIRVLLVIATLIVLLFFVYQSFVNKKDEKDNRIPDSSGRGAIKVDHLKTNERDDQSVRRTMEDSAQMANESLSGEAPGAYVDDSVGSAPEASPPSQQEQQEQQEADILETIKNMDYETLYGSNDPRTPPQSTTEAQADSGGEVVLDANFYEAAVASLERVLDKPSFYEVTNVVYISPEAGAAQSGGGEEAMRPPPPPFVPLYKIMSGYTLIGHNSDGSKEMLAEITDGDLRGYRVAGVMNAGAYDETAHVKITKLVSPDGARVWPADGYFVDSSTRIPEMPGKTDRHVMNNLLFGSATRFAQAYAAALRTSAFSLGGLGSTVVNPDALMESASVEAAASTVSGLGRFKRPTFRAKPWVSVGIVFTSINEKPEDSKEKSGIES